MRSDAHLDPDPQQKHPQELRGAAAALARPGSRPNPAPFKPGFPPSLGEEHPGGTAGHAGGSTAAPSRRRRPVPSLTFHFFLLAEAGAEDMTVYAQVGPYQQVSLCRFTPVLPVRGQTGLCSRGVPTQDGDGLGDPMVQTGRKDSSWTTPGFVC